MPKRTSHRYFSAWFLALLAALFVLGVTNSSVQAQDMDEDATGEDAVDDSSTPVAEEVPVDPDAIRHGIGLRLRYVFVPKGLIEIFMEEAAGGMGNGGFGVEYVRRKKNFEINVGIEYDKLSGTEGFYVESGGAPAKPGTTDFVAFDNLAWVTIDAAFVYLHPLSKLVSLRYGGGIGLGLVTGEVEKTDANCGATTSSCSRDENPGGDLDTKQDFFRVPPVFNLLGGVQLNPVRNMAINIEVGMRTVFYTGVTGQYFF